jgi:hypothetical protein
MKYSLLFTIIRTIEPMWIDDMRNAYKILVGMLKGKRPLGRDRFRQAD